MPPSPLPSTAARLPNTRQRSPQQRPPPAACRPSRHCPSLLVRRPPPPVCRLPSAGHSPRACRPLSHRSLAAARPRPAAFRLPARASRPAARPVGGWSGRATVRVAVRTIAFPVAAVCGGLATTTQPLPSTAAPPTDPSTPVPTAPARRPRPSGVRCCRSAGAPRRAPSASRPAAAHRPSPACAACPGCCSFLAGPPSAVRPSARAPTPTPTVHRRVVRPRETPVALAAVPAPAAARRGVRAPSAPPQLPDVRPPAAGAARHPPRCPRAPSTRTPRQRPPQQRPSPVPARSATVGRRAARPPPDRATTPAYRPSTPPRPACRRSAGNPATPTPSSTRGRHSAQFPNHPTAKYVYYGKVRHVSHVFDR